MDHQDFYNMSTADLQRATVTSAEMGRIITRYTSGQQAGAPAGDYLVEALLAQIAKMQVPKNCKFNVYSFSLFLNADEQGFVQQIVPQNADRKYLAAQMIHGAGMHVLFEEHNFNAERISLGTVGDGIITPLINRAVNIQGYEQFRVAPTNAVSVVMQGTSDTVTGIIIEGQ